MEEIIKDKFRGVLVGSAVGDSLGMCVEELTKEEVNKYYGDKVRFLLKPHPKSPACFQERGETSSEFQIVKLITEALIEKKIPDLKHIVDKFLKFAEDEKSHNYLDSHLIYALNSIKNGFDIERGGSSIEGALQSIPLGMYYYLRPQLASEVAISIVSLTYKNEVVLDVASLIAVIISSLIRDEFELEDEYKQFFTYLRDYSSINDTKNYLNLVEKLLDENVSYEDAIFQIGNGSYALESFSLALFIFLKSPRNTEEVIINGANSYGEFGGDTDAIGLLAGAFAGAYNGESSIPPYLKLKLKEYNEIINLADKLYNIVPHTD